MADPRLPDPIDERLDAELALLVDGELDPARAAELEAEFPERVALLRAGREQVRTAAASVEAPFELRRRVDALGVRRARVRRWRPLAALAGVGAAAAVALVLVTSGGAPTVDDVLAAAGRTPAAAISPGGGPLLAVEVEGVRFPNYEEKFGWRAVGRREEEIDGREVTTVYYRLGREQVRYSIVAGEPLPEPDGEVVTAEGTRLRRIGDGNAVTWRRQGHTCVMDGSDAVTPGIVAELAGWKAKGEVPF